MFAYLAYLACIPLQTNEARALATARQFTRAGRRRSPPQYSYSRCTPEDGPSLGTVHWQLAPQSGETGRLAIMVA